MPSRILIITPDVLAQQMAGPAIRAFQIAAELIRDDPEHRVTLVSTASCSITNDQFDCRFVGWHRLGRFARDYDVLIVQGFATYHAPALLRGEQIVVIDLYDPLHFEQLEQLKDVEPAMRRTTIDLTVRVLNEQAVRGDFFLCASDEQRHLWLGLLGAFGRINPLNYDADPSLQSLIAVCPFGLSPEPPSHPEPVLRGVVPGIGPDDKLMLWAGGVYNWFDPLTLLRAVHLLAARRPDLRLFFMGMAHPNTDIGVMSMADRTRELAAELDLVDRHVFFNEGWVPFDQRGGYLLEADLGVSTHYRHAETSFAFRTRILDYLWAGLPVVATEGDTFGRLIALEGLGIAVPERDPAALAAAIETALYDADFAAACRAAVVAIRPEFTWANTLAPLIEFCRAPERAPDHVLDTSRLVRRPTPPANPIVRATNRAQELAREGGLSLLRERVGGKLGRMLRRS
jgi:glycosyltransferase involved in cell wall biosynthesis